MYSFGDCLLDVAGRELWRGGRVVHLEPQAFDLLVCLVERRHEVLAKADLLDGVWGHRFLSDANLTTRIKEIRRAVGDDGTAQHTVRNVRGRGYRFVAELLDAPPRGRSAVDGVRSPTLVGREGAVPALSSLLDEHPLVTLVGPGGVGKSTLARAVVASERHRFAEGAHFVELAGLTGADDVVAAVARDLDIVNEAGRPGAALARLAALDALVVVDNCEHLADRVAGLVAAVDGVPERRVRMLATSRVRIGLPAERVVMVEPLDLAAAVELFGRRADLVGRSWRDGADTDQIARLVEALDRLPLMIEMAAARLGSMSFAELAAVVAEGGPLVHVTHRTPAVRHRSLESLVAWSASLLDPADVEAFRSFSVFAGAVTAADAAAVLWPGDRATTLVSLARLADHSLVAAEPGAAGTAYRMLATVRAVAARWLAATDAVHETRRRHAGHALAAALAIDDGHRREGEAVARARLDGLVGDLRVAHRWATDHEPRLASDISGALHLPAYSALWSEPAGWSRALLSAAPADARPLYGAHLLVAAEAANRGALDLAQREATLASASPDVRTGAAAIEVLADVAMYAGDLDGVLRLCDELKTRGRQAEDVHMRSFAATSSACAHAYAGRPDEALACLRPLDSVRMSPSDRAWLTYAEGEAVAALGGTGAAHHYLRAIDLAAPVGNRFVISVATLSLATEHARLGQTDAALAVYGSCLQGFERHGNLVHAVTTLRNLAVLFAGLGEEHMAAVLAGATSIAGLRPSYGVEAERLPDALDTVRRRVGQERFDAGIAEGAALGLDAAVRLARQWLTHQHR